MPFVATSDLLGLSTISLRDYMHETLAALPALLGYVSLGPACQPRRAPPGHFNGHCWRRGSRRRPWRSRISGRSSPKLWAQRQRHQPDENRALK
jgi:hypothetical protein